MTWGLIFYETFNHTDSHKVPYVQIYQYINILKLYHFAKRILGVSAELTALINETNRNTINEPRLLDMINYKTNSFFYLRKIIFKKKLCM